MSELACLLIDDSVETHPGLSGWADAMRRAGLRAGLFRCDGSADVYDRLQTAYQTLRAGGPGAVLGVGPGGAAALALAAHLPVARLVLIDVDLKWRGAANRLTRFASSNAALCVSDVLVAAGDDAARQWRLARRMLPNARLSGLACRGGCGKYLKTDCENVLPDAVTAFLRFGELPKNLAENAEMCIIYG